MAVKPGLMFSSLLNIIIIIFYLKALMVQCLVLVPRRAKLQRRTQAIILILHQCAALRSELGLRDPADLERLH